MNDPLTDSMREGLQAKYPYLMNETFAYVLLGVVVVALIIGFIWLRKRKNERE